ncbi:MAG: acyl-CoA dehydrogenase family protein [Sulfolobales archaeon]
MFPFNSITDFKIDLPQDLEIFRKSVREFVESKLMPRVAEIERTGEIPEDLLREAARAGFTGIGIPIEYGGQGGSMLEIVVLQEELARASLAFAASIGVSGLFTIPLMLFGREDQKKKYLPPIASGEKFAAHANTEPGAGSDVAGIQTRAEKTSGGWILNGRKIFITGAGRADYILVSARTSPPPSRRERWKGITTFIVEKDFKGLRIGQRFNVIGIRGEQPYEVILDNVFVPEENVLGNIDEGFKILVTTYDYARISVAAQAVGLAQGAFERALNYSLQRQAFERPIISFQGIGFKLAEMLGKLVTARLLTYWAASKATTGEEEFIFASSIAKMYATEVAEQLALNSIKIHGGVGLDEEYGVSRYLRDALVTEIYEGTGEIQRLTTIRMLIKKIFGVDLAFM